MSVPFEPLDEANLHRFTESSLSHERDEQVPALPPAGRNRWRMLLAFVGTCGLLVVAGGVFGWWQDRQAEDARRRVDDANLKQAHFDAEIARLDAARVKTEAEAEQRRIRNRQAVVELLERIERALQVGDAERATQQMELARTGIETGGIDDLRERLARCRADAATLRELDSIDNDQWIVVGGKLPTTQASIPRWEETFGNYGISPGVTAPEQAARRIGESGIRDRLLAALEVWFVQAGRDPALRAILAAADPDEFRNEVRKSNYPVAVLTRAFRGKSLPLAQPVWFTIAHGEDPSVDPGPREQLLLRALKARPKSFPIFMALGALDKIDEQGPLSAQVGWYRAALAVQPLNVVANYALAHALHDSGDYPAAIAAFREVIRLEPKLLAAHTGLGGSLLDSGDLRGAIVAYKEATRVDPKDAPSQVGLGLALGASGELPGAIAAFKEAIRLDPQFAIAHSNLGGALATSGDVPGAIAAYREAIRLDPKLAMAHFNLGVTLQESGNLPGAIAAYRDAIQVDPSNVIAHYNLGVALSKYRDFPAAIEAYREAIQLHPGYTEAHNNLGNALRDSGDLPGAIAAYKEAIRLHPGYAEAHYNLGLARRAAGDLPGAIASYKEALRLDPKDAQAHSNLGNAQRAVGDLPGAIASYKRALQLNSKLVVTHYNLGTVYFQQQKYADAIASARAAIKLDPKYSIAHAMLADALQRTGDLSGARMALTEAARLDPKRWGPRLAKLPPTPIAPPPREKAK